MIFISFFLSLLITLNPSSDFNCDGDRLNAVIRNNLNGDFALTNDLENIDKGLLPQRWMGRKILAVPNQGGCDIDADWQIDMSIRWLIDHGFSEKTTPYD